MSAPDSRCQPVIDEWIAYADKLEKVIELCAKASVDELTKLHAENGLRIVAVSRPNQGVAT